MSIRPTLKQSSRLLAPPGNDSWCPAEGMAHSRRAPFIEVTVKITRSFNSCSNIGVWSEGGGIPREEGWSGEPSPLCFPPCPLPPLQLLSPAFQTPPARGWRLAVSLPLKTAPEN